MFLCHPVRTARPDAAPMAQGLAPPPVWLREAILGQGVPCEASSKRQQIEPTLALRRFYPQRTGDQPRTEQQERPHSVNGARATMMASQS